MSSTEQKNDQRSIDNAISMCDQNITRHNKLALNTLMIGFMLVFLIGILASSYANFSTNISDNQRLELLSSVKQKENILGNISDLNSPFFLEVKKSKEKLMEIEKSKPTEKAADTKAWQVLKKEAEKNIVQAENVLSQKIKKANAELNTAQIQYNKHTVTPVFSKELMIGVIGMSIFIISIFTGMYRFHQKEITKNEHHKLGFMRIRIAANNMDHEGFRGKVRSALTVNAFSVPSNSLFGKKEKTIESPLPGHPTTDLATGLANKLLEQVEVILQPKPK